MSGSEGESDTLGPDTKEAISEIIQCKTSDSSHTASKTLNSSSYAKRRKVPSESNIKTEKEKILSYELFGNKEKLLSDISESKYKQKSSQKRQPVWSDADDEAHNDDVIDYDSKAAPVVRKPGKYKSYLEQTFHNALGAPAWANLNRESDSGSDDDLSKTVGHIVQPLNAKLTSNLLEFKRMKDLNRATYAEGPGITGVEFHKTSSVAVVTGMSGLATIYSIDGHKNEKLHSIAFKNYPIKSCRINKSGSEAIMGGSNKYFYTYDIMMGSSQRVFLPKNITKLLKFELSPCGQYICVIGRFGEVHLLSYSSKELICTFKQEHQATSVCFSTDSSKLVSHSLDAEITVFDIRTQRQMHRFYDEGCVNGSIVATSPNGNMLASGSEQGVVNIYDFEKTFVSKTPAPIKTILNITTGITAVKFNHSSEILAIASKHVADSIKLVHLPSGTVFTNFPGQQSKIGKPGVVSFSPLSGYMAIGNLNKEVPLYRLKHFNNY